MDRCHKLKQWLTAPQDPAALAAFRIAFSVMMFHDIFDERSGVFRRERRQQHPCTFPLFDTLSIPQLGVADTMLGIGGICAVCVGFGFCYRVSLAIWATIHWYTLFLEKAVWNNHSLFFGMLGIQLMCTDSHHWQSIDGFLRAKHRNREVPRWHYALLRTEIFLIYLLSGIKKVLSGAWLAGISTTGHTRSSAWDPVVAVFGSPFLENYALPFGGVIVMFVGGSFLVFERTLLLGWMIVLPFHVTNYFTLNIGMFPHVMLLASTLLFIDPERLRARLTCVPGLTSVVNLQPPQSIDLDLGRSGSTCGRCLKLSCDGVWHAMFFCIGMMTLSLQLFMPFSHHVTQGYATWSGGLYGYGLDMFVHTWRTSHIKVEGRLYRDDGKYRALKMDPKFFAEQNRWRSHPDMVKQFALCVDRQVRQRHPEVKSVQLFVDVWGAMDNLYTQRFWHPNVDLVQAKWSVLDRPSWQMPLVFESVHGGLKQFDNSMKALDMRGETPIMIADFPSLRMRRFIPPHIGKATFKLITGAVELTEGCVQRPTDTCALQAEGSETCEPANESSECVKLPRVGETLSLQSNMTYEVLVTGTAPAVYLISTKPASPPALNERWSLISGIEGLHTLRARTAAAAQLPACVLICERARLEGILNETAGSEGFQAFVNASEGKASLHYLSPAGSSTPLRREFGVHSFPSLLRLPTDAFAKMEVLPLRSDTSAYADAFHELSSWLRDGKTPAVEEGNAVTNDAVGVIASQLRKLSAAASEEWVFLKSSFRHIWEDVIKKGLHALQGRIDREE